MVGRKDRADVRHLVFPDLVVAGGRVEFPPLPDGYPRVGHWAAARPKHFSQEDCRGEAMPADNLQQRVGLLNPQSRGTPRVQTLANRKSKQPDYEPCPSRTFPSLPKQPEEQGAGQTEPQERRDKCPAQDFRGPCAGKPRYLNRKAE